MTRLALWRWPTWLVTIVATGAWSDVVVGRSPGWLELVCGLVLLALLALASAWMRLQGFVPAIVRVRTAKPVVALTFDDGPDPATTPAVLDSLARYGVHATFFVVANKAQRHRELVARIGLEGHELASHGNDHRWQSFLTPARARASLQEAIDVMSRVTGVRPSLFRPPYGVTTPALGHAVRELGLSVVGWTQRSWDTMGGGDPCERAARLAARLCPGAIVLLHDSPERQHGRIPLGPLLVGPLIEALRQGGLEAVTVSELLRS